MVGIFYLLRGAFVTLYLVLQNTKEEYETKQGEGKMFGLAWNVKDLRDLNEVGRELTVECTALVDNTLDTSYDSIANNLANLFERE